MECLLSKGLSLSPVRLLRNNLAIDAPHPPTHPGTDQRLVDSTDNTKIFKVLRNLSKSLACEWFLLSLRFSFLL